MAEYLMDFIDYVFVAFVLAGAVVAFGCFVWMVQEFFKGFLSVFFGMPKAEEIAAWIPYAVSGLLIVLLMWKVGH